MCKVSSLGGKRYFISFIDEFSRMMWLYLIKTKSEELKIFQRFKVMVDKQSEKSLKVLRTDRGGEYTLNEFEEFCVKMAFNMRLLPSILLNIMGWQRKGIKLCLIWQEACWRRKPCHILLGWSSHYYSICVKQVSNQETKGASSRGLGGNQQ